jgi:molybdate transport system ATP-binding protein
MARAAASASRLLLLDEPFSGLDMALASEIMQDLQPWAAKRNLCVLSVTHDVAEAFQLGAEVIKLAEGRVVEQGPVEVVLAEERAWLLQQLNGVAGSQA